jgi:hypothetical protein
MNRLFWTLSSQDNNIVIMFSVVSCELLHFIVKLLTQSRLNSSTRGEHSSLFAEIVSDGKK